MVSPRPLSKKAKNEKKLLSFLREKAFIAFLAGGLGEPLFGGP